MSPEATLNSLLTGATALTALVGTRIYPDVLPAETTYPAVVFAREKTERTVSITGRVFGSAVIFHVAAWGASRTQVDAVADQIEAAIDASSAMVLGDRTASYDPETDLFASVLEATLYT